MLGLFKKQFEIMAPVSGKVLELSNSPDPIFAEGFAGEGVVIEPTSDIIVAPVDGVLNIMFNTNHAFSVAMENGLEVLVHIGIETVKLHGEGFERIAEEGQAVKVGDPIIKIDRELITSKGFSLISPVLIVNSKKASDLNFKDNFIAEVGKDVIITYKR